MNYRRVYPTIWQSIPFSLDMMDQWDNKGNRIEELTLISDIALDKGVSEMLLNVSHISVLDNVGKEHEMPNFMGNNALNLKGMHTGLYLRTKEALELPVGKYSRFRFYLNGKGNYFFNKERDMEAVYGFPYMDFKIQNGLYITGNDSKKVILRFDFEPYSLASYFKPLLNLFKRSKTMSHKWANSFN